MSLYIVEKKSHLELPVPKLRLDRVQGKAAQRSKGKGDSRASLELDKVYSFKQVRN